MTDVDLPRLAGRFRGRPRTRFAPAPTGRLHLGHVLSAQHVWDVARALGGEVMLRIEDHDRQRSRPEFETGILDDLDWLGFAPDIFPTAAFRAGRCDGRQSDRDHVYREAFDLLRARGLVYACDCTRREIAAAGGAGDELRYPGTCRDKGLPLAPPSPRGGFGETGPPSPHGGFGGAGYGWRVRIDPGAETFDDGRLGVQAQDPSAQCGDVLIRDRKGNWTYQFAVTVDDWRQDVDLVIRGLDLLSSTGRQIRLARLLGREQPPVFLHHPLIMKSRNQKLSKSDGDTGIHELRARGMTAEDVLALAMNGVNAG